MNPCHMQGCRVDSYPTMHDSDVCDTEIPLEIVLARASLYNFLAAAFGDPPTTELLAAAADMLPDLPIAPLDELHQAYTRLLVGPGRFYAPPYASIYMQSNFNSKPELWGSEATRVEAIYRERGLEIAPGRSRLPDHLAFELQFMQHLCAQEANARGRGDNEEADGWRDQQQAFLRDHLIAWLPRFVVRISEVKAHPFYLALADLMLEFIHSELGYDPTQTISTKWGETNGERRPAP